MQIELIIRNVSVFQQREIISNWYLLLSGEVELYLPSKKDVSLPIWHVLFSRINNQLNFPRSLIHLMNIQHKGKRALISRKALNKFAVFRVRKTFLQNSQIQIGYQGEHVETLKEGAIFGELNLYNHSCSGLVRRSSEFVRISQHHFLNLYNRQADHLQPFIAVMSDLVNDKTPPGNHLTRNFKLY